MPQNSGIRVVHSVSVPDLPSSLSPFNAYHVGVTWYPSAADIFLIFPAFLIGAAFGALVGLGLLGAAGAAHHVWHSIRVGMAGSAVGAVIFFVTGQWWPPIIGPFVLCPALAITATLLFRPRV